MCRVTGGSESDSSNSSTSLEESLLTPAKPNDNAKGGEDGDGVAGREAPGESVASCVRDGEVRDSEERGDGGADAMCAGDEDGDSSGDAGDIENEADREAVTESDSEN